MAHFSACCPISSQSRHRTSKSVIGPAECEWQELSKQRPILKSRAAKLGIGELSRFGLRGRRLRDGEWSNTGLCESGGRSRRSGRQADFDSVLSPWVCHGCRHIRLPTFTPAG